ncbi:MAG: hypothetical protein K5906_02465 [Bacilli bacterium]|nr:hypothetical protein [Bacilli bacterium]
MKTEHTFTILDYKELQKNRIILHIFTILGGAALAVTGLLLYLLGGYVVWWILLFAFGLMMFGVGMIFEGAIIITFKKIKDVSVRFEYVFFDKEMKAYSYDGKVKTSDTTLEYLLIRKVKMTEHCLFLYLPNKKVLPLSSDDPKIEEIKAKISYNDIPKKRI